MRTIMLAGAVLALVGLDSASAAPPPSCQRDAAGAVDLERCAREAAPGSPERALALINLGTQAFLRQDFAAAARLYDQASDGGRLPLISDPRFHAFRGHTYERVGRGTEALADARTAVTLLQTTPAYGEEVLPYVLPILKRAADPGYAAALATFKALPARDWTSHANRAVTLMEIGDIEGARAESEATLKLQPNHPGVLNNACMLAVKAGTALVDMGYCEAAVKAAPNMAAVRDSYGQALAAVGRCREAEAEIALSRRMDPTLAAQPAPACRAQ